MSEYKWKTKDGTYIDVDDMSVDHLKNVVKMIIRNNKRQDDRLCSEQLSEKEFWDNEFRYGLSCDE